MLTIKNIDRIKHKCIQFGGETWTIAGVKESELLDGDYYQFSIHSFFGNKNVHIFLNRETKGEKQKEQEYYHYEGRGEYYELFNSWGEDMVTINKELLSREGLLMFMQKMLETIK
jgi:hypothetical protein